MSETDEDRIRADETDRCAQLVEMRADIARETALRLRRDGSYVGHNLWPLFSKTVAVRPAYERYAREMEAVAAAFEVVARCMRLRYDPRRPANKVEDDK
jgi:hypothetical protein